MYLVELGLDSILEDKILLSNACPLQAVHQLCPGVTHSSIQYTGSPYSAPEYGNGTQMTVPSITDNFFSIEEQG